MLSFHARKLDEHLFLKTFAPPFTRLILVLPSYADISKIWSFKLAVPGMELKKRNKDQPGTTTMTLF